MPASIKAGVALPLVDVTNENDRDNVTSGKVTLRGRMVTLDTDVGREFVCDGARYLEGSLTESDLKAKYKLTSEDWEGLAGNSPLLRAVHAERERRVLSGEGAREAARRFLAKAPTILNDILGDEQISPRHRIEAARELRQAADSGPADRNGPEEPFVLTINIGGHETIIVGETAKPASDDGDMQ
jgi:hypothetical protein